LSGFTRKRFLAALLGLPIAKSIFGACRLKEAARTENPLPVATTGSANSSLGYWTINPGKDNGDGTYTTGGLCFHYHNPIVIYDSTDE